MIKQLQKDKKVSINFKIAESEWARVLRLAKQYTDGNYSAWIRYKITQKPRKKIA